MRMKWIRFVCFVVIFCIGFSILNSLQPNQAVDRWENFYKLPENSVDIVFMGNSHNFVAFNPEIIDGILKTTSYVVGIDAENIIVSYYELKDVLKFQQPRAVVLETFALDLHPDRMIDRGYIYEFLDAGQMTINKIKLITTLLFPDHLTGIFPLLRLRMEWEKPYFYLKNLKSQVKECGIEENSTVSGALITPNVIPNERYEEIISLPDPEALEPFPEILDYTNKFLIACDQNNVTPFFVTAPIIQIAPRTYDVYAPLDKAIISKRHDLETINFNQHKFTQLHFYNDTHVNAFGSLIVSTEMAVHLSEELGIPLDQKTLDYYRSYYFDKFDISQSDKEATLTLYPSNSDALLQYAWEISKDDIILFKTDYQPRNSITFSTSEAGEYKIRGKVWNPDGDFVLEGLFTHIFEE